MNQCWCHFSEVSDNPELDSGIENFLIYSEYLLRLSWFGSRSCCWKTNLFLWVKICFSLAILQRYKRVSEPSECQDADAIIKKSLILIFSYANVKHSNWNLKEEIKSVFMEKHDFDRSKALLAILGKADISIQRSMWKFTQIIYPSRVLKFRKMPWLKKLSALLLKILILRAEIIQYWRIYFGDFAQTGVWRSLEIIFFSIEIFSKKLQFFYWDLDAWNQACGYRQLRHWRCRRINFTWLLWSFRSFKICEANITGKF